MWAQLPCISTYLARTDNLVGNTTGLVRDFAQPSCSATHKAKKEQNSRKEAPQKPQQPS